MVLPHLCYYVKFGQPYERNYGDLTENVDPSRPAFQGHYKVTGTDTDRSAAYDLLLVFHGNYTPTSYRFRNKGRYFQKKFPPLVFTPAPAEGFPWNFVTAVGVETLE